jgi:hypothetical protein
MLLSLTLNRLVLFAILDATLISESVLWLWQ